MLARRGVTVRALWEYCPPERCEQFMFVCMHECMRAAAADDDDSACMRAHAANTDVYYSLVKVD